MTLEEMRRITEDEIKNYHRTKTMLREWEQDHIQRADLGVRINAGRHADPTAAETMAVVAPSATIQRMRGWAWAIETTFGLLLQTDETKARVMQRLYSIDGKRRSSAERAQRYALMEELSISEPTLYRWRDEILHTVMAAAIQAGALVPFDKRALPGA